MSRLADGKLVIGVPTVPRPRDYLAGTVASLVAGIAPAAWERVEIVVLDATPPPARHAAARALLARHAELVRAGRLTLLETAAPAPELQDARPRPGEAPLRAAWRRKLVLDFVRLAETCARRGTHYLHVEDDMLAAPGFHAALEPWFDRHFAARDGWAFLSLFTTYRLADRAELPLDDFYSACAVLWRAEDLAAFARYARRRAAERELDFLMRDFAADAGRRVHVRSPALFQHVGVCSSFTGETRPMQAASYEERLLPALWRGAREALDVARRRPRELPELLRWRAAVLIPALQPAWARARRAARRLASYFGGSA